MRLCAFPIPAPDRMPLYFFDIADGELVALHPGLAAVLWRDTLVNAAVDGSARLAA